MKKVLIIAYHFPPRPGIGGLRIEGLARHLPEFGWAPVILTPILPENYNKEFKIIQTPDCDVVKKLKKKLKFKTNISKECAKNSCKKSGVVSEFLLRLLGEILAFPDSHICWHNCAVKMAKEVLRNESFDALISSSRPVTCHLIGRTIKLESEIPWIADSRDLWTDHYDNHTLFGRLRHKRLEFKTLRDADMLVTVSSPLAQIMKEIHKRECIYAIPNGFNVQSFSNIKRNISKIFLILYTGELYKGKRDPIELFSIIRDLILEGQIIRDDIKISFYGPHEGWLEEYITRYGLSDLIEINCSVPHEESLIKQQEAQLLLLLLGNKLEDRGVYTGKLFEYLAAQRPILALGGPENCVVRELLSDTKAGFYGTSYFETKQFILDSYNNYKETGYVEYKGIKSNVEKYSQREMARKFAILLNSLVEDSGKSCFI